jgi:hypothetical protein
LGPGSLPQAASETDNPTSTIARYFMMHPVQ